jgi:hypothetical protein
MGGDYKSCGKLTNTICPMTCKIGVKNNNYSGTCQIYPRNIPAKFGSNWPSGFGEEA